MTKTFEIGNTYSTRSICDHNCIFSGIVTARTAKTVTMIIDGESKRFRPAIINGSEVVFPYGRFSMAPALSA